MPSIFDIELHTPAFAERDDYYRALHRAHVAAGEYFDECTPLRPVSIVEQVTLDGALYHWPHMETTDSWMDEASDDQLDSNGFLYREADKHAFGLSVVDQLTGRRAIVPGPY